MKNLVQNLDKILEVSGEIKTKYQDLKKKNRELEVQLSDLKVEADQYKQEIIYLKKELEEKSEKENNSMLSQTDNSSVESIAILKQEQKANNNRIQLQLDEFIEDIDQCIQIIQAKE